MIWERIIAQENYHSSCWLSSWPWKHDSLEMFSITFTGWSYLWATCHSFLIRLSSIEELIVLQETKYTALCSSSIGFYSIEIEQTAYRNIFHCNLDHTPNFYRRQSRIFSLKKLEPMKCEQKLSSIWAGWAEHNRTLLESRFGIRPQVELLPVELPMAMDMTFMYFFLLRA